LAHRFESEAAVTKDAMTDAEVRAVLARLADERVSPKVADVAAAAGASEADVRRILEEVRAEQARVEIPVAPPSPVLAAEGQTLSPRAKNRAMLIVCVATLLVVVLGMMLVRTEARTIVHESSGQPTVATEEQPAVEASRTMPAPARAEAPSPN
jgi:uncharacterized membrane protein